MPAFSSCIARAWEPREYPGSCRLQGRLSIKFQVMMENKSMPISLERLIDVFHKIQTWVLAGLAAPFISKLVLDFFAIKPMGALSVLEHQTVLMIGIFAFCVLVFKGMRDGSTKLQEWRKYRVPTLDKLTDRQRRYLIDVFNTGSYIVEVHTGNSGQQWFRELKEKGYMEYIQPLMRVVGDQYSTYLMTSKGWERVEQYVRKSPSQNR